MRRVISRHKEIESSEVLGDKTQARDHTLRHGLRVPSTNREFGYFVIYSVLILTLFWRFWVSSGNIMSNGDVNAFYGTGHRLSDLTRYLFNDYGSASNLENYNTTLFVRPILLGLQLLHQDSSVNLYRVGTLTFLIVSYLSATYFLKWVLRFKSTITSPEVRLAQFIGACFFALSPYILNVYPAGGFWLAYGLTPAMLVLTYKILEDPINVRQSVALALCLSFIVIGTQYLIYAFLIMLVITLIESLHYLLVAGPERRAFWTQLPVKTLLVGGVFVLLNLNWILPTIEIYLQGGSISPGYSVTRGMIATLGQNANLFTTAISADSYVQVQEHLFTWLTTYSSSALSLRYVLVTIGFIGLFARRSRIADRFFYTLFGIMLLFWGFSIGLSNPIYNWLVFNSPIKFVGWIFRDPSKLTYFLWIGYALGITLCAEWILIHLRRYGHSYLRWLVTAVALVVILLPSFNELYSIFDFYFVPTRLPSEYVQLYDYLSLQPQSGLWKVAFLAPYYYGYDKNVVGFEDSFTWDPKRMIGQVLEQSSPMPSVGYWHMTYRVWQSGLYSRIYPEFTNVDPNSALRPDIGVKYLAPANVRYVVFHNDIVGAHAEGLIGISKLEHSDLRFVRKFGKDVYLFVNPYAKPLVYANGAGDVVKFKKINPTEISFTARLSGPGDIIHFAQEFDPLWVMRVGDRTLHPIRLDPENLIGFKPGKRAVTGTIYYLPQSAYWLGVRISLSLAFVAACILVAGTFLGPLRSRNKS